MSKPSLSRAFGNFKMNLAKHSPEILLGLGISGMVASTVLAVRATPKALKRIEERKEELETDKLTPMETVKTCWTYYIPATVSGATSIACLIFSNSVHAKRYAVVTTAYKLSEAALTEYQEKVVETIGTKREREIRDSINKDHLDKTPQSTVIITNNGTTKCLDYHSGRYFTSDMETIKRAVNEINRRMVSEMYVSLNEFYDELDLEHTDMGNDLGWHLDDGLVEVDFSSHLDKTNTPCLVMNYRVAPHRDYYKFT